MRQDSQVVDSNHYFVRMANLTPDNVRRIAFSKPPLGRRGYAEEEVDAFLDEVERTLTALYDQIARMGGSAPAPSPENGGATSDLADIKASLARIESRLNASGNGTPGGAFF